MARKKGFLFCRCKDGSKVPVAQTVEGKPIIDFLDCKCEILGDKPKIVDGVRIQRSRRLAGLDSVSIQIEKLTGSF